RRRFVSWTRRRRDLSALHASLNDELVSPRERLLCLGAYLRASIPIRIPRPFLAAAARRIEREAKRLLRYRHIRAIRQPPIEIGTQNLIWLDGERLCVTREFLAELGNNPADRLTTLMSRSAAAPAGLRTEVMTPTGRPAVLVRRCSGNFISWVWAKLRGRRLAS